MKFDVKLMISQLQCTLGEKFEIFPRKIFLIKKMFFFFWTLHVCTIIRKLPSAKNISKFFQTFFISEIRNLIMDHTWRAAVHGDHYVTDTVPGVGMDWDFI